jgi:hypothetical protein
LVIVILIAFAVNINAQQIDESETINSKVLSNKYIADGLFIYEKDLIKNIQLKKLQEKYKLIYMEENVVFKNIQPDDSGPSIRFTIESKDSNCYKIAFKASYDRLEVDDIPGIFLLGDGSIIRFECETPFPLKTTKPVLEFPGIIHVHGYIGFNLDDARSTNSMFISASPKVDYMIFNGQKQDPLSFALLKDIGFIYLHGKGFVVTKSGDTIVFPPIRKE